MTLRSTQPILIAGPTAVGKSAVALALAEEIGGELISVDSMQVYRGLDIGTAKPSPAERACVPHHLIDVVELAETFDASKFCALAHRALAEIQSRGKVPILCGGTGLYFKAFLEGLGEAPPANPALRTELESTPVPELLLELQKRDPAAYESIDRKNPRRVVRAIEVIRLTGKPFSAQRADWKPKGQRPDAKVMFALTRSAKDLRGRIDARVEHMFAAGLVEETKHLLKRGLLQNKTAMQAIGYRQVVEHLRGDRSLAGTGDWVKIKTRQFAKRQLTWFRNQPGIHLVELEPADKPAAVAERIHKFILP